MSGLLARLSRWNRHLPADSELDATLPARSGLESGGVAIYLESVSLRSKRPVLEVRNDRPVLRFRRPEDAEIWTARLSGASSALEAACRAVGRVEVGDGTWFGTGWLVGEDLLVTNRHVAQHFSDLSDWSFVREDPLVDFRREVVGTQRRAFKLLRVVHIEPQGGPDLALLQVARSGPYGRLSSAIQLAGAPRETDIVVIGYPGEDDRIEDRELALSIFGPIFGVKRLSPGWVTSVQQGRLLHDATTAGGSSGSVVLDFKTGEALGLHYSGRFLQPNRAVRCDAIRHAMENPQSGPTFRVAMPGRRLLKPAMHCVLDRVEEQEAHKATYRDRNGYQEEFLGNDVPMPVIRSDDVLRFEFYGDYLSRLDYHNFSVVMCPSRRMCWYSAVNIDGRTSVASERRGWRTDSRIGKEFQILKECYGRHPKFSRGHMTRREDPAWGEQAQSGSDDSMHVTNAVPQMQRFNSPVWLELENYALNNARDDNQRITVFTGPYFRDNDPVRFEVQIPQSFWKVIVFVHDETQEICATGFELSQEPWMPGPDEEHAFDGFQSSHVDKTVQVAISKIAEKSGLDFGELPWLDPMEGEETVFGSEVEIWEAEQIRWCQV